MEGLFDTTLPDPTMVEFYRRLKNREILWNDDIDDATIDIALYIKKWNDEDKDLAIEDRQPNQNFYQFGWRICCYSSSCY